MKKIRIDAKTTLLKLVLLLNFFSVSGGSVFHIPDKVYLHLDRNLYAQGDTIWIKGYAMERGSNKPSNNSYAIHVQMLNEEGKQVGSYKFLTVEGQATGQIEILGIQEPGFYQLVAHTGYMKNFSQRFFYKTTIEVREKVQRRAITTLFDKAQYLAGDTAEITFSVLDQNKSPVSGARFVYECFAGEERLSHDGVKCYDDGTMKVRIPIENRFMGTNPRIQLSYFADDNDVNRVNQDVYIPIQNKRINLSFFPEGGDRLAGVMSKIAFKASDDKGNAVNIEGVLYKDGDFFKNISTQHEGMGITSLMGDSSVYSCKITSPKGVDSVFALPATKKNGYTLFYKGQTDEMLYLSAAHNLEATQNGKLWISYCDSLLSVTVIQFDKHTRIPIPKSQLPAGIVTFTLSNATDEPQAERLIYVDKHSAQIQINTDKHSYQTRERINMLIDASSKAKLSFAIVDSLLGNSSKINATSIKAYTQLETELQGRINNTNQYLGTTRSVKNKRDLLLMTHGWRRFEWIGNRQSLSTMQVHDFNRVYGKVTRLGKPYPKAKMGAYMLGESIAFSEFRADEQGRFFLDPNYQLRAYQDMVITARDKKGRSGLTLSIQNTDTLLFSSILKSNKDYLKPYYLSVTSLKEDDKPHVVSEPFMLYDTHLLQEFEISADRRDWDMDRYLRATSEIKIGTDIEEFISFDWLLNQVSNRILTEGDTYSGPLLPIYTRPLGFDDPFEAVEEGKSFIGLTVFENSIIVRTSYFERIDLVRDLRHGVYLSLIQDELDVIFNEANYPCAMIYVNDKEWGYDFNVLNQLTQNDILAVAILDGNQGYERFGVEAYYGAILLYIRPEAISQSLIKKNMAIFGNFVKARQFAKPIYDTEEQIKTVGDDKRITLHWEPLLETDENGKAEVSFYTGDIPGKKQIVVQGFDEEGNLYYQTGSFVVKDVLDNR